MSRYILHQAVACGGAARGFNQGGAATTCAVYASEWLSYKVNGQSDPFSRTDPVAREFTAVVRNFPALYQGQHAAGDKVAITVADHAPKADYAQSSAQTKASWGTVGGQIERRAVLNLSDRITPRQAVKGAELTAMHGTEEYREELFAMLSRPGPALVSMSPRDLGTGHVAALYVTDSEFCMFDSLVGELVLPLANLRTWFDTDKVSEYFDKRAYVSAFAIVLT